MLIFSCGTGRLPRPCSWPWPFEASAGVARPPPRTAAPATPAAPAAAPRNSERRLAPFSSSERRSAPSPSKPKHIRVPFPLIHHDSRARVETGSSVVAGERGVERGRGGVEGEPPDELQRLRGTDQAVHAGVL